MRTREVLTGARKVLVMAVAAAFVVALTAAPAHAAGVGGPPKVESMIGIYEQMPMQEILDAVEVIDGQHDEPAEPGEDEECPDPDIGEGDDWEPGGAEHVQSAGTMNPPNAVTPPQGGEEETPTTPSGGNEETPTVPSGGDEETPTVPSGSDEDTPTQTTTEKPKGGSLPFTGGNGTALAVVGLGVILGGIAMLAMRRDPRTDR